MATREDFQDWIVDALESLNGSGTIVQVAKHIWENHSKELQTSGNLFYTWQYDIRWAVTKLRIKKIMLPTKASGKGIWRLR